MPNIPVENLKKEDVFKHGGEIFLVVATPNIYKRGNAERVEVPARKIGGQRRPVTYLDFNKGAKVLRMDMP